MKTVATIVSALLCSTAVLAAQPDHKHIAKSLSKRFSGQATYFYVGLGACGKFNVASDFIVALNTPQYGSGSPGPQCFKTIQISAGGKTASATIMDECPTCDYGSLDMSEGLFTHFNPTSVGEFPITWEFVDGNGGGNGGGNDDPPKPKPTPEHTTTHHTTSTHHTTPTTTWQPPPTTHSTTRTTPTSTKVHTTTTKRIVTTTTSTSSAPAATTSSAPSGSNIESIINVFLAFQGLLRVAAN